MVFPVVMYGCESWTIKKAERWRIDAFELWCWRRLMRVPWRLQGDQPWIVTGRTDAEAKASTLWPPDAKSQLIRKDSDAGKDWGQEGKGMTEGEMVGWHHQLSGHEFEQAPGGGEGQRSLVCCSPRGRKESDTTERLKNGSNKATGSRISDIPASHPKRRWQCLLPPAEARHFPQPIKELAYGLFHYMLSSNWLCLMATCFSTVQASDNNRHAAEQ